MTLNGYSLWLAGTTALVVPDPFTDTQRFALESVLFAQLRADRSSGSRHADYSRWYSQYREALEARGWVVTYSKSDHQQLAGDDARSPLQRLVCRLEVVHPSFAGVLQAAVARLAQQAPVLAASGAELGAVDELGIMLPGPALYLCGQHEVSDVPASPSVDFRESGAELSALVTPEHYRSLHEVIITRQHAAKILNLGALGAGAEHGNA